MADDLFVPNYAHHDASTPDFGHGPESEKKRATLYRNALQDFRLTIEELIADGETAVARWSCRGAHKGELNREAYRHHRDQYGAILRREDCGKLGQLGRPGLDAAARRRSGSRQNEGRS